MKIIAIAGGSGAGKSTVSYHLVDTYPDRFQILNFDDYQLNKKDIDKHTPRLQGMINWDHPDIIQWDKLIKDLQTIRSDKSITIQSWAHRSNPYYSTHGKTIDRKIEPKPILIIEGYLALHNPTVRELYDVSFYFDVDQKTRDSRRDKDAIIGQDGYVEKVLTPMFKKYVEPTKDYADTIIDVTSMTVEEIADKVLDDIRDLEA